MSIRDTRLRTRRARSRSQVGRSAGPVPRSSKARRHVKLSMRRRRQALQEEVRSAEAVLVRSVQSEVTEVGSGLPAQRLSELTGLTPAMEACLRAMGQTRFFQLAHWSGDMVAKVAGKLGCDPQHIHASNWIGQARSRG